VVSANAKKLPSAYIASANLPGPALITRADLVDPFTTSALVELVPVTVTVNGGVEPDCFNIVVVPRTVLTSVSALPNVLFCCTTKEPVTVKSPPALVIGMARSTGSIVSSFKSMTCSTSDGIGSRLFARFVIENNNR